MDYSERVATSVKQPVMRIAQVLDWGVVLDRRDADLIRGVISASITEYDRVIRSIIQSHHSFLQPSNEEYRWQRGIKSILDSREYVFSVDLDSVKLELSLRVCVTVCEGHRRSKIHVRLLENNGRSFDTKGLIEFRTFAESFAREVQNTIRHVYRSHVFKVLEFGGRKPLVDSGNEIIRTAVVFGANTDAKELVQLFDRVEKFRLPLSSLMKPNAGIGNVLGFYGALYKSQVCSDAIFRIFDTAEKKMLVREREELSETTAEFLAFQKAHIAKKGNAHELASRYIFDWSGGY